MARKSNLDPRLLTNGELELMECLWKVNEGSVRDVLAQLPEGRDLAYTSVSTILRILEKKGVVDSRKVGRGHMYRPLLARDDYQGLALNNVVHKVFRSEPSSLVARLLEDESLSDEQLQQMRELIESRLS